MPPEIVLLPDSGRRSTSTRCPPGRGRSSFRCRSSGRPSPSCPVPEFAAIPELHVPREAAAPVPTRPHAPRAHLAPVLHRGGRDAASGSSSAGLTPLRKQALAAREAWILERLEQTDGLGAIFPPIINTILALRCLGYAADHPRRVAPGPGAREARDRGRGDAPPPALLLARLGHGAGDRRARRTPALPADDPALLNAARWLLDREVSSVGDWQKAVPRGASPAAGTSSTRTSSIPTPTTPREVLTALARVRFPGEAEDPRARARSPAGRPGMLAMQNEDGGWGAFDRDCDNEVLTFIPFADHNAMIDPSCEDITGRTLEALDGHRRARRATRRVRRAASSSSGSSKGTAPGTAAGAATTSTARGWRCAACCAPGEDLRERRFQRAADWLRAHQNADGGWGELPRSYDDPSLKGRAQHALPDGLGADGPLRHGRRRLRQRAARRRVPARRSRPTTAPGRTSTGPAPASRRSSIFATTSTRPTSRSGRSSLYAREEAAGATVPAHAGSDAAAAPGAHRARSELMRFPPHIMTDTIQHSVRNAIRGQQALPVRADARAALHVQPRLHRLRDRAPHRASSRTGCRSSSASRRWSARRRRSSRSAAASRRSTRSCRSSSRRSSSASATSTSARTACSSTRTSTGRSRPHKRLMINVHLDGMRRRTTTSARARASSTRPSR